MRRVFPSFALAGVLILGSLTVGSVTACGGYSLTLSELAAQAVSKDAETAAAAIAGLRDAGPAGLDAMFEVHAAEIARLSQPGEEETDPALKRLHSALDAVGGQRDCHASRLFWYTDIEQAKDAAHVSGKPILSLRMLGNLTEELSCANSRFFRSVLYANGEVGQTLRDKFILHWQSVRPVPKVTIEFGDGRKLLRTVTGNSAHYVLDTQGRPIDGFPGLYGPQAFLRGLNNAVTVFEQSKDLDDDARTAALRTYHRWHADVIMGRWHDDLRTLGLTIGDASQPADPRQAVAAHKISVSKGMTESVVLTAALLDPSVLERHTDDLTWARIAEMHKDDAQLDEGTIALMRSHNPLGAEAGRLAMSKMRVEDPIIRVVRNFQNTLALDTVRNEYTFHRQLHEWMAGEDTTLADVNVLNERVYAELFLTPSSDPWLGLMPDGVYTALDRDGVCVEIP